VQLHGFAGLRDGCRLLRELIDRILGLLYPEIEDGDLDRGPPTGVDEPASAGRLQGGGRSALSPRHSVWVRGTGKNHGRSRIWAHQPGGSKRRALRRQSVGRRVRQSVKWAPPVSLRNTVGRDRPGHGRAPRSGSETRRAFRTRAPGLVALKQATDECHSLIESNRQRKRELEPDADEASASSGAWMLGRTRCRSGMLHDRAAAHAGSCPRWPHSFRRTEPHSPVSYLVGSERCSGAHAPGALLEEVIKDEGVLCSLRDTLGLKTASRVLQSEENGCRAEGSRP